MPSIRAPRTPSSSSKKNSSIITKTIGGGISKKTRKSGPSPKSPSAITPDRHPRRPNSKQLAVLLRGIERAVMQNVLGHGGHAEPEPEPMQEVLWESGLLGDKDSAPVRNFVYSDAMDTREDYEWTFPGFNGYLLQEYKAKVKQFPEMHLSAADQVLYLLGEITAEGIA